MVRLLRAEWMGRPYPLGFRKFTYAGCAAYRTVRPTVGLLFNPRAWWVGVHYSSRDKRWCINIVPCLTVWITRSGGSTP